MDNDPVRSQKASSALALVLCLFWMGELSTKCDNRECVGLLCKSWFGCQSACTGIGFEC